MCIQDFMYVAAFVWKSSVDLEAVAEGTYQPMQVLFLIIQVVEKLCTEQPKFPDRHRSSNDNRPFGMQLSISNLSYNLNSSRRRQGELSLILDYSNYSSIF